MLKFNKILFYIYYYSLKFHVNGHGFNSSLSFLRPLQHRNRVTLVQEHELTRIGQMLPTAQTLAKIL